MSLTLEQLTTVLDAKLKPINDRLERIETKMERIEKSVDNLNKHHGYDRIIDGTFKVIRSDDQEM